MQLIQCLFCLFFVTNIFAQTAQQEHRLYSNYAQSWFECSFPSKDPTINDYCKNQSDGVDRNFLTAHFKADSTYEIGLSILEIQGTGIMRNDYFFKGRFELNEDGQLLLIGKHPFKMNTIKIKGKKHKKGEVLYGFTFQLNDTYSWTNNHRLKTHCDGTCEDGYED